MRTMAWKTLKNVRRLERSGERGEGWELPTHGWERDFLPFPFNYLKAFHRAGDVRHVEQKLGLGTKDRYKILDCLFH